MEKVECIVIDGFHEGHSIVLPYSQTIRLPKPAVITIDECCGGDELGPKRPEILEYKECFRAVDRKVVLYSVKGESRDVFRMFPRTATSKPWTPKTMLYYNFLGQLVRRTEDFKP